MPSVFRKALNTWNVRGQCLHRKLFFPEAKCATNRYLLSTLENALNPHSYLCGSFFSLNKVLVPEAADGFATVHRWARDILSKLDPSPEDLQGAFLTDLYKAFTFARLRRDGLFRVPSSRHPRLVVRYPSGRQFYTLRDFLSFMDGSGDLERGIRFFE
jgi:hypothetical protein